MADYSEEIADAIEMIAEFGGPFKIERLNQTVPDATKPWRKDPTPPSEMDVTGVMLEFKKSQQSQGFTAGSEDTQYVLPGDMVVYIAADDPGMLFTPMARDIVYTPRGEEYGVVDNLILSPNGQDILYKLWIRK